MAGGEQIGGDANCAVFIGAVGGGDCGGGEVAINSIGTSKNRDNWRARMGEYIDSAINMIYEGENDHIVIGLTGRTGSGCSTVAKILQCDLQDLHHSLYKGDNPTSNDERKQKIIYRHLLKTWHQFQLIQVRSIITLLLIENDVDSAMKFIKNTSSIGDELYLSLIHI